MTIIQSNIIIGVSQDVHIGSFQESDQIAPGTPTTYTTDFSEYTIDENLSDWTDIWNPSPATISYKAQANTGTYKVGTKHCALRQLISGQFKTMVWDDPGATIFDSDILVKVNMLSSNDNSFWVGSRVSGEEDSENIYAFEITSSKVRIVKYVSGSWEGTIGSVDFDCDISANYYFRCQTSGTTLRCKIWKENAYEPNDWVLSITDSDIVYGSVGFGAYAVADDFDIDYFSCGTEGDEPVFPPITIASDLDEFGYVGESIVSSIASVCRMMGGQFLQDNRYLTGIRIPHNANSSEVRIAVYTGGALDDPDGATLLYDFGEFSISSDTPITASCSPIYIPANTPVWVALKASYSWFGNKQNAMAGNAGNFQSARGRCDVTSDIGYDGSIAFPSTLSISSPTFANYWYDWNIEFEALYVENPVMNPLSGTYLGTDTIEITCGTSGSTIYYTTDGSDPTELSSVYSAPLPMFNGTLKALAMAEHYENSEIITEVYSIGASGAGNQPHIFIIT